MPVAMGTDARSRTWLSLSRSVLLAARPVTVPLAVTVTPEGGSTPLSFTIVTESSGFIVAVG